MSTTITYARYPQGIIVHIVNSRGDRLECQSWAERKPRAFEKLPDTEAENIPFDDICPTCALKMQNRKIEPINHEWKQQPVNDLQKSKLRYLRYSEQDIAAMDRGTAALIIKSDSLPGTSQPFQKS